GKLRGARQDAYVQLNNSTFTVVRDRNSGSVMYFGKAPSAVTLWLDGTNGGLMAYTGSDNVKYSVVPGAGMQLPAAWKSPTKYDYVLAGWVNIYTGDYYAPGDRIDISENTVLYADWVAESYDIGRYNTHVADTVSTNDFITTHMFDYSSLINLLSSKVTGSITADSHSETWSHVQGSDTVSYKGQETLDFSFDDHDSNGHISSLNNTNAPNTYTGGTAVYPGIYSEEIYDVLFRTDNLFDPETGEGIVGKHYLGEGDHLFQLNDDGYYYYDAKLNAASYNQSDERFYVYEYLARTSDSAGNNDEGKYSDFLPLNSPYTNTAGQGVETYTYNGDNGEYAGVTHYQYDARNDTSYTRANLWFGMRVDIQFALPDAPGSGGNKDIYGNDMVFKFTGDDDVWVLVDGEVVLDLGGIHQAAEGEINFSTGKVTVEGKTTDLKGVAAGERTLTILYLERGSSMSNCAIYFNLAPRSSLDMQKEDVLTQEVLKGAKFAFYYDEACTEECRLWPSREAYKEDPEGNATNVFTIGRDGALHVWGLDPAKTYYIKEVGPPTPGGSNLPEELQYALTNGIIRLTLDKNGLYSYSATILEEPGANPPISHGFTVHGFRIDEETQSAYISITNAQNWVTHSTSIYVEKTWSDGQNHAGDTVTAYLNVTDPNGTVRRLREVVLSEENDWKYTWTNLPMYVLGEDGLTESDRTVEYSVSEAYMPGYAPKVEELKNGTYTETTWAEAKKLTNGGEYLLRTDYGYLAASADGNTLYYITAEVEARTSADAIWKITTSTSGDVEYVRLTAGNGKSINYNSKDTRFNTSTGTSNTTNLRQEEIAGGIRLYYRSNNKNYYVAKLGSNGYLEGKNG
ncbi:MAG: fibro-slime domain-containing protein, partial [Clostridia bacterium]|nr:fibro-slime domain-containing protein [Clostridia bacterium]